MIQRLVRVLPSELGLHHFMDFAIFCNLITVKLQRHVHKISVPQIVVLPGFHCEISTACVWELFHIAFTLQKDFTLGEPKLLGIKLEVGLGGIWGRNKHLMHPSAPSETIMGLKAYSVFRGKSHSASSMKQLVWFSISCNSHFPAVASPSMLSTRSPRNMVSTLGRRNEQWSLANMLR